MARTRTVPAPPREVRKARDQFEKWRRDRQPGERIPDRLWRSAVALCKSHTAHRVARWLRLNDTALRDRVREATKRTGSRRNPPRQTFIEMIPPPAIDRAAEYVVEVGSVRVRVRGAQVADVAELARVLGGETK